MIKNFLKENPIHRKIVPNFDLLFLFRPTMFFAIWLMIAIGMYLYSLHINESPQWIFVFDFWTFIFFTGITLVIGATLINNQIDDIEIDKLNNKLFILNNSIDITLAKKIHFISLVIGMFLLLLVNIYIFVIGIVIFIFWDKLYNDKKFAWKKNPVLGPLCNVVVGLLLIISGWIFVLSNGKYFFYSDKILSVDFFIAIVPYILSYLAVILLTDIPDIEGDKKYNKITFAIKYSVEITLIISTILVIAAFIIALLLYDPLSSTSIICSMPFFIYACLRQQKRDILRAIRYPIFILNFFTITIYPYLCIACGVVYFISKYYYWHRFDLHYPTFLVEND